MIGDDGLMSQHVVINGADDHRHRTGSGSNGQQQQHQQRGVVLSGGGGGDQLVDAAGVCLGDPKPDAGSPLLSISEVTNTLLNQ